MYQMSDRLGFFGIEFWSFTSIEFNCKRVLDISSPLPGAILVGFDCFGDHAVFCFCFCSGDLLALWGCFMFWPAIASNDNTEGYEATLKVVVLLVSM